MCGLHVQLTQTRLIRFNIMEKEAKGIDDFELPVAEGAKGVRKIIIGESACESCEG